VSAWDAVIPCPPKVLERQGFGRLAVAGKLC